MDKKSKAMREADREGRFTGRMSPVENGECLVFERTEVEEVRCTRCGWEGRWSEVEPVTVYEDYGDVCCYRCPHCGRIEYDGMEMFEEVA